MANKLDLAEQQLLGYSHGKRGYSIIHLIESMGLTKTEWKKLQIKYKLHFLSVTDSTEIDNFFDKKNA